MVPNCCASASSFCRTSRSSCSSAPAGPPQENSAQPSRAVPAEVPSVRPNAFQGPRDHFESKKAILRALKCLLYAKLLDDGLSSTADSLAKILSALSCLVQSTDPVNSREPLTEHTRQARSRTEASYSAR